MEQVIKIKPGELNQLLGKFSRLHSRRSFTEFSKIGITQGEPRILRYLNSHEGCIQREICDNCHLEPATVTNIMARMERDSLIKRQYESGSRRNLQVFLTQKGRESLQSVEQAHRIIEEECFSGFTSEEKEQAKLLIERICNNLVKGEEKNIE